MLVLRCFFSPSGFRGTSAFCPLDITNTHYSHNPAPPTTQSDGFLWTTTSSCCCNARSSNSSNSSSTCCRNTRCCCNTRCCNTSKENASTSSDILAAGSHATAAEVAVLISGSTSTQHKGERRCTFGSEDVLCLGLLHEVAPAVPSAGRTGARTSLLPASPTRQGECRLYTHNGAKALIRHLRKASYSITHPRRVARNASCERTR